MRREGLWKRTGNGAVDGAVDRSVSVLANELSAFGRIDTEGEILIHGTVKGDVYAAKVVLGVDGLFEGTLVAQEVVLQGKIRGRVFAFTVTIEETAIIRGNVFHHELTMAPGAQLDGLTPWRPINYFHDISRDLQGDADAHVRTR